MASASTCVTPQLLVPWGHSVASPTLGRDTVGSRCVLSAGGWADTGAHQVAPCPGQGHAQAWHVPVAPGHGVVTPAPLVLHGTGPTPCPEPPQGWSCCHLPVPPISATVSPISATVPPPAPRSPLCPPEPSPQG